MCGPRPRQRSERGNMANTGKDDKAWFEGTETEDVRFLREALGKMKSAINNGLSFDEAAGMLTIPDPSTKDETLDDILKVLIAEMHFNGGKSVEDLAKTLRLPLKRIQKARAEMMTDVKAAAIEAYHDSQGRKGNA